MQGKLRILFVTPVALADAQLPYVPRDAEALEAAGHDVEVFRFDNRSYRPWRFLGQLVRLRALIRRTRPDVVHAQFGSAWVRAALGLAASQLAAFCARSIVCESREIESNVDLKTFVPCDRAAARRHLGLGEHERIVLFNPGRDPALQDPQLAAAAVAEAREYFSDVRSVVLEPAAPAEQIAVYMNAADVLLVTSKTEGSGAVVHEAMACNLPVVSVDVGDVRERLEGVAHCAVMSRDPVALGAALAEVLRAPQRSDGRVHVAVAAASCALAAFPPAANRKAIEPK